MMFNVIVRVAPHIVSITDTNILPLEEVRHLDPSGLAIACVYLHHVHAGHDRVVPPNLDQSRRISRPSGLSWGSSGIPEPAGKPTCEPCCDLDICCSELAGRRDAGANVSNFPPVVREIDVETSYTGLTSCSDTPRLSCWAVYSQSCLSLVSQSTSSER